LRTLFLLVLAVLSACAAEGVSLEMLTAKAAYQLGTRPVAVIRLTNAGTTPAIIRSGWGRKLPMEFATEVQLAAPDAIQAVHLLRFGPALAPKQAADGLKTQELAADNAQLTLAPGGRAQWLVMVPKTLDRAGEQEIPWAMPPLIAEQGGKTTPLTSRGTLTVTVQTPATCLAAAGVAVTATVAAENNLDMLRLRLQTQAGRLPREGRLEDLCLLSIQDSAGAKRQERLSPGGASVIKVFGGEHLAAELVLPLINANLLTDAALPGRLQLGWRWCQWFPDQEATPSSTMLAWFEAAAGEPMKQPDQLPDYGTWPRRDDAGTYPEAGRWLAVDVDVTVTCDAKGRMVGTPKVQVNRAGH